jgi:protocatechuate 3,4-dioxygenase beta subunit
MLRTIHSVSLVIACGALLAAPGNVRAQAGTATAAVQAQPGTASIWGKVTDNHGSPLGGAKVTLVSEDTKASTGGSTDGTGQYHFEDLKPGTYDVTFDATGFVSKQHKVHIKPGTKKVEVSERLKPPPEPAPKSTY